MCETLLRGVKKKVFFNPGLADRNRGEYTSLLLLLSGVFIDQNLFLLYILRKKFHLFGKIYNIPSGTFLLVVW